MIMWLYASLRDGNGSPKTGRPRFTANAAAAFDFTIRFRCRGLLAYQTFFFSAQEILSGLPTFLVIQIEPWILSDLLHFVPHDRSERLYLYTHHLCHS